MTDVSIHRCMSVRGGSLLHDSGDCDCASRRLLAVVFLDSQPSADLSRASHGIEIRAIECGLYSDGTTFCALEVLKVLSWFVASGFARHRHRHGTLPRRFCPVPLRRPDVGTRQSCLPTLSRDGIHLPRRFRRSARATRPSWPSLPRGGLEVSWSRREGEFRTSSRSSKGSH